MLFVIDDSIIQQLTRPEIDPELIQVLDDLGRFRRDGHNLIYASRRVLKILSQNTLMSKVSVAVYKHLHQKSSQMGSMPNLFSRRIDIVDSLVNSETIEQNGRKVFRIHYKLLENILLFAKPILLAENQIDAKIYIKIADAYLRLKSLPGIKLVYVPQGGGGNTTASEYHEIQAQKERLCLCILDSDQKTPLCRHGATSRRVKDCDDPEICFTEYLVIRARDIENLLPTEAFRQLDIYRDNDTISFLERGSDYEARFHLDLKNGIKLGEIHHSSDASNIVRYWQPILSRSGLPRNTRCASGPECTTASECVCSVSGFGSRVANQCYDDLFSKNSAQKNAELVSSNLDIRERWEEVGELITAWCCGSNRISTISRSQDSQ